MKSKKQIVVFLIGGSLMLGACQPNAAQMAGGTQPAATGATQPETTAMTEPSFQPSATTSVSTTVYPADENLGVVNANLLGESMIARQGEWYFHANESSKDGIIKSKWDRSEQSVLINKSTKWLNLVGDWLYFVDYSSSGNIAKIKTDGTGYEILHNSMVTNLIVRDDWIYFIDITEGRQIHRIKTDGSELTKLDNRRRATRLFLDGNMLYWSSFLDGNTISQDINTTAIDGSNKSIGGLAEYLLPELTVGEGDMFFHTPEEHRSGFVYRRNAKSDTISRFMSSEGISLIGVYRGWLYFYEGDREKSLSRIRTDGKDREVILEPGNYGRVQFLGDRMIYYDNYFPDYGYWMMDLDGSNVRYFR